LAETLLASREPEAAERVLRESLAAVEGVAWRRTVDATPVRETLASLLESTGRYDAALDQRQRILDEVTVAFDSNPTVVARANIRLLGVRAALARQQGLQAEEEELSRLSAELAVSELAVADPLFQSVLVHRAAVLHQRGRTAEAENLLKRAIPDADSAEPAAREADLTALRSGLAEVYARSGRLDESLAIRRDVLRDCMKRYGEGHAATQRAARAVLETMKAIEKQAERSQPAESAAE
jgi:tetratricopeptide (TPR) repeat protein